MTTNYLHPTLVLRDGVVFQNGLEDRNADTK